VTGPAALTREIAEAGVGVTRLLRYDPAWSEGFDPSTSGFLRSFLGPILAIPFVVIVTAMVGLADDSHVIDPRALWAGGISQFVYAFAYPAVLAFLARPLEIGAGYGAFVVVVNWTSLFLNIAITAASVLVLAGAYNLFGFVWLVLFGLSLFAVWRAARETLGHEIGPALMAVVLWVGLGVACDRIGQLVMGLPLSG
jgi:hypothetical protein